VSGLARLPIRIRVTLAFAAVMAIVLGAAGVFIYSQLQSRLDESIDNGLRSRAGEVSALVRAADAGLGGAGGAGSLIESDESFAQVLTTDGQVEDSTPQLGEQPVLSGDEAAEAAAGGRSTFFERESGVVPGIEGPARLLAAPVEHQGGELIVVVGSSLGDRDEALTNLATLLLIGGPIALLLASLAGYWVAGTALRPVETMRRRAADISASGPEERLPLPEAKDELRRLGETLNEMLERLEAALERERRFVDDASHELRTPLTLHKTELELALRYGRSEEELRAAIASAGEEIDRLIQLAEDLLVVARSEKGQLAVTRERVQVGELLDTVGERFRARVEQSQRPLVVDGGDGVIQGDRLRLEQALTSMVDNALRYGEGEVRLWARRNGGSVELHVSDDGPGFPPEFIGRAFERFSRADAARARGGTGLGLAIVDTIARAHGGRGAAANASAGGADVWIEVPADASSETS
jgi:two-component system, OmpR family, sensor kinase